MALQRSPLFLYFTLQMGSKYANICTHKSAFSQLKDKEKIPYFYRMGGNPTENFLSSCLICYYRATTLYQKLFKMKTNGAVIVDFTVLKYYKWILFLNVIISNTQGILCFLHIGKINYQGKSKELLDVCASYADI